MWIMVTIHIVEPRLYMYIKTQVFTTVRLQMLIGEAA